MRLRAILAVLAVAGAALAVALTAVGATRPPGGAGRAPRAQPRAHRVACDSTCLTRFVGEYLKALVAHNPSQVPIARHAELTENGQRLQFGDGLWRTLVGVGTYRHVVPDVVGEQVAFVVTVREESDASPKGVPIALAGRLRIRHGQITQAEDLAVRDTGVGRHMQARGLDPLFNQAIPPGQRASRRQLIATANEYFSGMQLNDGKGHYPFTKDCNRVENGQQTANVPMKHPPNPSTATTYSVGWSCLEQFKSGLLHFVTRIHDRRFVAVDPSRGVVFSFVFFDHASGATRTFKVPDGRTVTEGPTQPWTWEIAEVFKIQHAKIRRIEAVLTQAPYGMTSGWSSWRQGMSTKAQDATGDHRS